MISGILGRLAADASDWVTQLRRPDGYATGRYVLSELRRVIVAGQIRPGATLPVDEIGAFLRGESDPGARSPQDRSWGKGLVRHQPRGGYTVTVLSGPELHEIYLVRGALEAAAIEAATAAAPAVTIVEGLHRLGLSTSKVRTYAPARNASPAGP